VTIRQNNLAETLFIVSEDGTLYTQNSHTENLDFTVQSSDHFDLRKSAAKLSKFVALRLITL